MSEVNYALTAAQRGQYDADGYLILPGYFDTPAVQRLSDVADALVSRVGPLVKGNPRIQVDPIGSGLHIRQVWPIIDLSDAFAALARDPRVVDPMISLFNDQAVLFEDKLNYKHALGGSAFPMHQDYSYWHPYSPRLTSAFIYLDEATEENGCLEVVPGWHKRGLLPKQDVRVALGSDHSIPSETLDPAQSVPVTGPPGTGYPRSGWMLFSCLTPHTSRPNLSQHPRRAVILTYNPAADGAFYEATSGANRERSLAWLKEQRSA
jgi:hypothetical protein